MAPSVWRRHEAERVVSGALKKVAQEVDAKHVATVAIAYVIQKAPYVFPVVGGRKVEHLHVNLEALQIVLTPEHIKYLESVVRFDPGFSYVTMISNGIDYNGSIKNAGYMEKQSADQSYLTRQR